jgi:hypothetical protein
VILISENLYVNVAKKIAPKKLGNKFVSEFKGEIGNVLANLFYERKGLLRKKVEKELSNEDIAQILLNNSLVENEKMGLAEANLIIKNGIKSTAGDSYWFSELTNVNGKKKYQIEHYVFDPF